MIAPDIPFDEASRLLLLSSLRILDSAPEEEFDRITRVARQAMNVQTALVSLIDTDRQWFKSKIGLEACETPRDISFCGHAILSDELFVIGDAQQDPRFFDNPLVTQAPFIRFYAGYPIKSLEGVRLGTLCVFDSRPRHLTSSEAAMLKDLGALVEREFAHRETATIAMQSHAKGLEQVLESRTDLDVTFEQAATGLAWVALDGTWMRVNQPLCDFLGYTNQELMALTFQDITYPDDLRIDLQSLEDLLAGLIDHYTLEKRYVRKDGQVVWAKLTVSLRHHADGTPQHFISVVEDIQRRKASESALKNLRDTLEQRVGERTAALQQANQSLSIAVNQQLEAQAQLRRSEALHRSVLETAADAFISIDAHGLIIEWNRKAEQIFGWSRAEVLGQLIEETLIPPTYRQRHTRGLVNFLQTGQAVVLDRVLQLPARRRDGVDVPVEMTISHVSVDGQVRFNAFLRDVSARQEAEAAVRRSQQELRTITDSLPVLVAEIDTDGVYRFANATWHRWYGVEPGSLIGLKFGEAPPLQHSPQLQQYLRRLHENPYATLEVQTLQEDGEHWEHYDAVPRPNADGKVGGYYVMVQDITARKELEHSLSRQAMEDALTGLSNRRGFEQHWHRATERAKRVGKECALLYLDLDGFKGVNDTHGHDVGDAVLIAFAARLTQCIRQSDIPARLGGDEFVVVLEFLSQGMADAENVARKIIDAMREPLMAYDQALTLSTSIGIASFQSCGQDARMCVNMADEALYTAKRAGKNRYASAPIVNP
ncbi:PAS domain S-box protein [Amantichitinum ursilacus]|uniref:Putative diguanylate cyclase YegE n=1 Tax=Amantichitinum ursilacus TaxID=857265 RepID=A0A0N0GQQ3_9NEIS|nr:PAS domain S-box protein [Amantichitinum ursilacus]KPC54661.1 putative diguanylate cyclase YegE [Amantichitinum ursilacus]